ncbi:uncharacterized protein LOC111711419 [Eurytemora carolleeae]|uniref:uncharacterized protein LOC111711419 n=1 Tax=Eurytemora carolleeae TaxID=1294199 RepID=UPI000C78E405|nr:uncharacterized protein LOC111711419 [Eurytemora carolleeae]|eukprot:XP_023341550.1 uncharacterized protein LOC111711419 [Eurytemora affinis]
MLSSMMGLWNLVTTIRFSYLFNINDIQEVSDASILQLAKMVIVLHTCGTIFFDLAMDSFGIFPLISKGSIVSEFASAEVYSSLTEMPRAQNLCLMIYTLLSVLYQGYKN